MTLTRARPHCCFAHIAHARHTLTHTYYTSTFHTAPRHSSSIGAAQRTPSSHPHACSYHTRTCACASQHSLHLPPSLTQRKLTDVHRDDHHARVTQWSTPSTAECSRDPPLSHAVTQSGSGSRLHSAGQRHVVTAACPCFGRQCSASRMPPGAPARTPPRPP